MQILSERIQYIKAYIRLKLYLVLLVIGATFEVREHSFLFEGYGMSEYITEQAGTVLGQAQLKIELELYFTSFKICRKKLIKLFKLC